MSAKSELRQLLLDSVKYCDNNKDISSSNLEFLVETISAAVDDNIVMDEDEAQALLLGKKFDCDHAILIDVQMLVSMKYPLTI